MRATSKQKEFYDKNDFPDAPEGWFMCGKQTYLSTNVKDPETNKPIKSFRKFEDAIAKAEELKEYCAGITKTSMGYSLRVGPAVYANPEKDFNSGLASWIKGDEQPEILERKTRKSKKTQEEDKESEKVDEVEKVDEAKKKAEKKEKKKAEKKEKKIKEKKEKKLQEMKQKEEEKKKQEEEKKKQDEEKKTQEEEEDEDEEEEVEEIEIEGKTYWLTEDKELVDPETSEFVGEIDGEGNHKFW